jgi:hypothetical protein
MTTWINFGINCVDCPQGCIDDRHCLEKCSVCINNDCENHPQSRVQKNKEEAR